MTDKEIKKALECCNPSLRKCIDCPFFNELKCHTKLAESALDLINHQQAEIDNLKAERNVMFEDLQFRTNQVIEQQAEIERLTKECGNQSALWSKHYEDIFETAKETIKSEAIKEFAERLRFEIVNKPSEFLAVQGTVEFLTGMGHRQHEILDDIDNLVKEMVGEDK